VEQAEQKLGFLQLHTQICGDVLEIVAKPDESVVSKWMGDAILRVEVPAGIAVSSALSFGDTTLERDRWRNPGQNKQRRQNQSEFHQG